MMIDRALLPSVDRPNRRVVLIVMEAEALPLDDRAARRLRLPARRHFPHSVTLRADSPLGEGRS
jgi:hypothetical protein